jgi:hypothetical protein
MAKALYDARLIGPFGFYGCPHCGEAIDGDIMKHKCIIEETKDGSHSELVTDKKV